MSCRRSEGAAALYCCNVRGLEAFLLVNQEALALLASLDLGGHPSRHRTPAGPGFAPIPGIAIFGCHLLAFERASFGAPDRLRSRAYPTAIAKGGKLTLQLPGFGAQNFPNIVTHLN